MNNKKQSRKQGISHKEMFRYLSRFKLKKKQRQIAPRTFANTQGLTTDRLQAKAQPEFKKPLINNNVRARLESDLQYLLEHQPTVVTRVKHPESYFSLTLGKRRRPIDQSISNDCAASNTNISDVVEESFSARTHTNTQTHRTEQAKDKPHLRSALSDELSLFALDMLEEQNRPVPLTGKSVDWSDIGSYCFDAPFENNTATDGINRSLSLPKATTPFSTFEQTRKMKPRVSSTISHNDERSLLAFSTYDDRHNADPFLDEFDLDASDFRGTSMNNSSAVGRTNWSRHQSKGAMLLNPSPCFSFSPQSLMTNPETNRKRYYKQSRAVDCVESKSSRSQINEKTRTRTITKSIGRVGESPFMEQIVIQKIKY